MGPGWIQGLPDVFQPSFLLHSTIGIPSPNIRVLDNVLQFYKDYTSLCVVILKYIFGILHSSARLLQFHLVYKIDLWKCQ